MRRLIALLFLLGSSVAHADSQSTYTVLVERAKSHITKKLKDPSSVQWRGLYVAGNPLFPTLCGEMNAKNSFGGYAGFIRFYSSGDPAVNAVDVGRFNDLKANWDSMCSEKLADVE